MSDTEQAYGGSDIPQEFSSLLKKHYFAFEIIVLIFSVFILIAVFALYSGVKNNSQIATDIPVSESGKCKYASNAEALLGAVEHGSINDCDCIDDADTKSMCTARVSDMFFYKKAMSDLNKEMCDFIVDSVNKESCLLAVEDKSAYAESMAKEVTETEASVDFEKAYEENPTDIEAILQLAVSYAFASAENETGETDAEMYPKAYALLDKAKELAPNNAKVYATEGFIYSMEEQYEKAVTAYSKSIELDANNIEAFINRGKVYELMDRTEEAQTDFEKAKALDTKNVYSKYF